MDNISEHGPNLGKLFPTERHVENFNYNGFMVEMKKGFSNWTINEFIEWTDDPGIGRFKCSDGATRLIPSCQIAKTYLAQIPPRPKLKPLGGEGVLFGPASKS